MIDNNNEKIAVVAIEIPWRNIECLGIFDSFAEANKAAEEHAKSFFAITGEEECFYDPIECFGKTQGCDEDYDERYEFVFLAAPFEGCYVQVEDMMGGDIEFKGPYHDHEEANKDLFGPRARRKFIPVPGTFGMGFYPVERGCKIYTYLPIYGEKGGN